MLPIDQEFSSSYIDDSTTIETLSNFQNEIYYEEGYNWKGDGRSEEGEKYEKNRNGSIGKVGDASYQNGTIKMVYEVTLLVKEGVSSSGGDLNRHHRTPQCQDRLINMKEFHNGGTGSDNCKNHNHVINTNEH